MPAAPLQLFEETMGTSLDCSEAAAPLDALLARVRYRLWLASITHGLSRGLLWGAAASLALAATRPWIAPNSAALWPLVALPLGGLVGLFVGAVRRRSPHAAARLLDRHFDLKDRSVTTLEFAQSMTGPVSDGSAAAKRLQIEEAAARLQRIDPDECVTIRPWNRTLQWATGLAAAALVILALTRGGTPPAEARVVLPLASEQSADLRETMLPEIEQLARESEDPEIEQLVQELREKVDQMQRATLDESDLMATLSEMEQSLAEAREALQLKTTDATMKALAAAIKPADELQASAAAMESEDYQRASEELKSADPSKIGDKQRRAVSDNLKKMVRSLAPGQSGQLSESIQQLAQGLSGKNSKKCRQCLSKLAKQCQQQSQRKKIGQCMSSQLNRLAQCKSQCRGQCNSNVARKSNRPSTKAGQSASGQPQGDKATEIDAQRQEQQLTGVQGEGPSETEILQAPEGEQQAVRAYRGNYDKFRREAEAVLESEPLPMGVRETVRTYFEAIRPKNESVAPANGADDAAVPSALP
jgi:hypothetical protein